MMRTSTSTRRCPPNSEGKPTLVFCNSRKATTFTAGILAKESNLRMGWAQRQLLQNSANQASDQKLADCLVAGVGIHHAGLELEDRRLVEELFSCGDLPILASTSTLAMGVNLPAHLVVVKSTGQMISGTYREYSESQILQMIGRAGRPQFDTSATALILTTERQKAKYESLVNGTQLVESFLHDNLLEHLNAEIVLGTIQDIGVALEWLKSTYFYVRAPKNPRHYGIAVGGEEGQLERKLQDLCVTNLNALARIKLIKMTAEIDVRHTRAGALMARYYVAYDTMKNFASVKGEEELSTMVDILCKSKEFQEIPLRRGERTTLNALNKDKHKATIRFQLEGKVKDKHGKVYVLMQAHLGCLHIADNALQREAARIVQVGQRLAKCLMEYIWSLDGTESKVFRALRSAVILCKCLTCGIWNNSAFVAKQFERVGPAYSASLAHAGYNNLRKLREADPRDLEMVLNKQPPFGNHIRNCAAAVPEYELDVQQVGDDRRRRSDGGKATLRITVRLVNADLVRQKATAGVGHACLLLVGGPGNSVELKVRVSDRQLLGGGSFERQVMIAPGANRFSSVPVKVHWISERVAGADVLRNLRVSFSPSGGGGVPSVSVERPGDQSIAEFLHESYDAGDANETGAASRGKKSRLPAVAAPAAAAQQKDLSLSPSCLRELQTNWSPVSQYMSHRKSASSVVALSSKVETTCRQPLTITKTMVAQTYKIDIIQRLPQPESRTEEEEAPVSEPWEGNEIHPLPSPIPPPVTPPTLCPAPIRYNQGYARAGSFCDPSQVVSGIHKPYSSGTRNGAASGNSGTNQKPLPSSPPAAAGPPSSATQPPPGPPRLPVQMSFDEVLDLRTNKPETPPSDLPADKMFDFSQEQQAFGSKASPRQRWKDGVSKADYGEEIDKRRRQKEEEGGGKKRALISAALRQFVTSHEASLPGQKRPQELQEAPHDDGTLAGRAGDEEEPATGMASFFKVRRCHNPLKGRSKPLAEFYADEG